MAKYTSQSKRESTTKYVITNNAVMINIGKQFNRKPRNDHTIRRERERNREGAKGCTNRFSNMVFLGRRDDKKKHGKNNMIGRIEALNVQPYKK